MKPPFARILTAALLLSGLPAGAAEKVAGYDSFKLIRTRNMFDPNRKPVRVDSTARTAARPNRNSSLTLTGTMATEGKALAFFDGTRADYRKVLTVGESIADGKITAIKATQIELERAGKPVVLAVGQQLQIDGAPSDVAPEEPAVATPTEGSATPADPAAPVATATAPASAPPNANEPNEVLRRMMERRQKEMSK